MYKQYKLLIFKKAPPPVTYKQTNKKCELAGQVFFSHRKVKVKKKNNSMRENIKIDYKLQRF